MDSRLIVTISGLMCRRFQPASQTTKPIKTFYTLDKLQPTFEASALFVAMNLVLIMSWVTFSPGAPYRRPFYTNRERMGRTGLPSLPERPTGDRSTLTVREWGGLGYLLSRSALQETVLH